jgi:MFS family permease
VLSAAGFFALLLALNQGELLGWTSPPVAGLLVLAAALGVAFLAVERRSPAPMIDLRLFEIRAFSAGLAAVVVAFAGLFTATFLLPFLLQEGSGYTPLEAGLLLTPIPITAALVAPFSGALSDRIGQRVPASIGIAVLVVGLLSLTTLPEAFTVGELTWRLALIGAGQGLFLSPNSSSILGSVPRPRLGTASGMIAQMRVVGQAFGIVISGAVVAVRLPAHLAALEGLPAGEAQREALVLAIHDAFIVAALICSVGIVASLLRGPAAPSASQGAVQGAEASAAHGG